MDRVPGAPSMEVQLGPSFQPVLSSVQAMASEVSSTSRQLSASTDRLEKMYGKQLNLTDKLANDMRNAVKEAAREILGEIHRVAGGATPGTREAPVDPVQRPPSSEERARPHASGPNIADQYRQAREDPLGTVLPGIRQGIVNRANSYLEGFAEDREYQERLAQMAGLDPGDPSILPDIARALPVRARLAQAAGTAAESGSVSQGIRSLLPSGAMGMITRVAGGVGVVAGGVQLATDFAEAQRAQNAQWQQIVGGDTMDALRERAGSQMFQWGQMGTLGARDAERLYEEVARTRLDETGRRQAQDFATSMYADLGVSIDKSITLIKTAAKTGGDSLVGLRDAMERMGEVAERARVPVEQAQQTFINTYEALAPLLGGGPSGVAISQAYAASQMAFGPELSGQIDLASSLSDMTNLRVVAGRAGFGNDLAGFMDFMQNGDPAETMRASQLGVNQAMARLPGFTEAVSEFVSSEQPITPGGDYSDEQYRQLVSMLRNLPTGATDPQILTSYFSTPGQQIPGVTPENVHMAVARLLTGFLSDTPGVGVDPAEEAEAATADAALRPLSRTPEQEERFKELARKGFEGGAGFEPVGLTEEEREEYDELKAVADPELAQERMAENISRGQGGGLADGLTLGLRTGWREKLLNIYWDHTVPKFGNKRSPIIERLIESAYEDMRVTILSEGGEEKEVPLEDALKYYPEQLAAGGLEGQFDVTITSGAQAGASISDFTGVAGDQRMQERFAEVAEGGRLPEVAGGEAPGTFAGEEGGGAGGGKVTLAATSYLRKLLRPIIDGNGLSTDPSWQWGPSNYHPSADEIGEE